MEWETVLGLRDLYSVTWSMATTATALLIFVPDFSWRVLGLYATVSAIVFALGFSNRHRRVPASVARQLTARHKDVAAT